MRLLLGTGGLERLSRVLVQLMRARQPAPLRANPFHGVSRNPVGADGLREEQLRSAIRTEGGRRPCPSHPRCDRRKEAMKTCKRCGECYDKYGDGIYCRKCFAEWKCDKAINWLACRLRQRAIRSALGFPLNDQERTSMLELLDRRDRNSSNG